MNNTILLQELFNNRIFRIPDYQRGYAWEELQVGEFLDDLDLLGSTHHRHYTGTIVLHKPSGATTRTSAEGRSYVEADVVDGQQRLTTIVLLLNEMSAALSDHVGASELSEGIRRDYVEVKSRDGQPLYKLSLNEETDRFFKDNILQRTPGVEGPRTAAAQRLLDAKKQIADHLRAVADDAENAEHWLQDLHAKVTTRLHFNVYEVEHPSEVGIVFELVNDRGKPLTNLEKVKNYLLYTAATLAIEEERAKDDLTKVVNDAWAYILQQLASAELASPAEEDRLLRAHWTIEYDPSNWDGSKSIKQRFDLRRHPRQHRQILGELHGYVEGLRGACICYCDALSPARDNAFGSFASEPLVQEDVKLWNSRLARTRNTATFLPLLMAVRKRWPSEPKKYLEVVKLLELIAFRFYWVADYRTNYRQSQMFGLAHEVVSGMEFDEVVKTIRRHYRDPRQYARRHFGEFIDSSEPKDWYWRGYLTYFLYEYEQHLASGGGAKTRIRPRVGWADIRGPSDSIEHVLPQSIEDRPGWQRSFSADSHERYLHDIGNLTLTERNSELSNREFAEKRKLYTISRLFQELEIAKCDEWTPEAVDNRRAKLLAWAKERWHMDFSDLEEAETESVEEDQGGDDDSGEEAG